MTNASKSKPSQQSSQKLPQSAQGQSGQGSDLLPGSSQSQSTPTQTSTTEQQSEQSGSKRQPRQPPGPGLDETAQRGFNASVAQECIGLVETYCCGDKSRGWVTVSLASKLGIRGNADNDPTAVSALDAYCAQVDEIDAARRAAGSRSQSGSCSSSTGGDEARSDGARSRTIRKSKGKRRADRTKSRSGSRSSRRSPSRSISPLSLSEDEPSSKRQKPDASGFAWSTANAVAEKNLRPEVYQTLVLLRRYAKDIRFARSNLINSVGAPEFPEAEWGNILRGKPVDLDHVFSGQYSLGQDEKHTEKLGPVELSYRAVTPAKTVKSAGDWVIAWQKATAAILYAFPHRKLELEGYYAHVFGLFGAIHPDYHSRVLDYDRAARKKAAAVRTILLTDVHEFSFLRTLHIDSIGASVGTHAGYSTSPDNKRRAVNRKVANDDPCRRWNRGNCNATDSACRYSHRCSTCGSSGHPATGCSKDGKHK